MNVPKKKKTRKNDSSGTKEQLIIAATEIFAKKGYAASTTRMISKEAGLNVALISRYFGSKEQLFMTLVELELERMIDQDLTYPPQPTLEQELKKYFQLNFQRFEKNL
jgi:AcrR family transcriptional regulator